MSDLEGWSKKVPPQNKEDKETETKIKTKCGDRPN